MTSPQSVSCSVMSDSLWSHGLQHARLPCPSPTPRACSNSCPSSRWYHLSISSSVVPFSSCLQSFPASGSFPMSQFFASSGQSIGVSASASVLPMNIQDWFPLGWTGWNSLQSKGLSRVFSNTTVQKHQFFITQPSLQSNSHIHTWLLEKTIALTRWIFVGEVMSLLFNMLSRLAIAFLPSRKCLLISWLQSLSAVWATQVWEDTWGRKWQPTPVFLPRQFHGQRILVGYGVTKSWLSVLPMNIQEWFLLGLMDLISLQPKGLSSVFSKITVQKHLFFDTQLSL